MKSLILVSCILAVVSAGWVSPLAYSYPWAHHVPVLDHNGYQLDTPEVAHAKSAHFAAHAEARGRIGYGYAPLAYSAYHVPAVAHGVPADTPEVAHAKAAHFAAHAEATARNAHHLYKRSAGWAAPLAYAHAYPQHIPVIGANGVPLDTPEVAAAKVSHAAAHVEAAARSGEYHHAIATPVSYAAHVATPLAYTAHHVAAPVAVGHSFYHGAQHIPVIGPNGVPLDTPEVAAGKAANAVAHAEAHARNGDHLAWGVHGYAAHVAPVVAGHHYGAQHIPVIGPNGVPLDTPEVAAGKAANAVAHAEAHARNGDHYGWGVHGYAAHVAPVAYAHHVPVVGHGVPLDTPEVAAAKVHHAAAHAEALARNLHHH